MKQSKAKLIPVAILMLFLLAISCVNFFNFSNTVAGAVSYDNTLSIELYDREGDLYLNENQITFNGSTAYQCKWEDVKNFGFSFDFSTNSPVKNLVDGIETYSLVLQLQYKQAYKNEVWTNVIPYNILEKTVTGANSYLSFSQTRESFIIDNSIEFEYNGAKVLIGTWGIYRFRLTVNGVEFALSDYYVVEPTLEILEAPKIAYNTTSSKTGLRNAYNFFLTNGNLFKYIDKRNLKWYGLGKTKEGTTYALEAADLDLEEFQNCDYFVREDWGDRQGQTFYFDDEGYSGDWKIWCEYNFDGNPQNTLKSNVQKISTEKRITFTLVMWILLGVCAVSITVTILICVYKNKREKIY